MKKNNSKLTPRGYDSYELFKKTEGSRTIYANILVRKSFLERYWFAILLAALLAIGFVTGQIDVKVEKVKTEQQ